MKEYLQDKPQCLLYAFAMCYEVEPEELIKAKHITCIERYPALQATNRTILVWERDEADARFADYLLKHSGVLTNYRHAVAWSHIDYCIKDPNGGFQSVDSFAPVYFFIVD